VSDCLQIAVSAGTHYHTVNRSAGTYCLRSHTRHQSCSISKPSCSRRGTGPRVHSCNPCSPQRLDSSSRTCVNCRESMGQSPVSSLIPAHTHCGLNRSENHLFVAAAEGEDKAFVVNGMWKHAKSLKPGVLVDDIYISILSLWVSERLDLYLQPICTFRGPRWNKYYLHLGKR
jgi:hypothetical protein